MNTRIFLLLLPLIVLFGCTSAEQTTEQQEKKSPEVYVFDDVSKVDTSKIQSSPTVVTKPEIKQEQVIVPQTSTAQSIKYIVQLGAFTTRERAESFVRENQSRTSLPMSISLNGQSKLYTVQIPPYKTKEEADVVRDNLRKFPVFKDAFTIAVEK
jgi:cell division protein FtsN